MYSLIKAPSSATTARYPLAKCASDISSYTGACPYELNTISCGHLTRCITCVSLVRNLPDLILRLLLLTGEASLSEAESSSVRRKGAWSSLQPLGHPASHCIRQFRQVWRQASCGGRLQSLLTSGGHVWKQTSCGGRHQSLLTGEGGWSARRGS